MTAITTHEHFETVAMSWGHNGLFMITRAVRFLIGTIIAGVVFATLFLAVISVRADANAAGPHIFGRHYLVVRSGSMSPALATGSMVAIHEKTLEQNKALSIGTIVAFRSLANSEILITHRIVDKVSINGASMYQTKGDANATADNTYLEPERILGTYSFSVPRMGFLMVALQGRRLLLTLTAAFALASISMMLSKRASLLTHKKVDQI